MLLRDTLAIRNSDLYSRLQVVETKARQLLEYSQAGAHLTFTPHGLSHVSAVEENCDWLLSDDDRSRLNPYEIFCLLCGIFFHDALMIPARLGDESNARALHAQRVATFLNKNRELLSLDIHEANAISQVVLGHAANDLQEIQKEVVLRTSLVNIHKLAAILSIADICHADSSRAPEIVFRHLELDEESAFHWRRHLQISGITRKANRLIMSAIYFSEQGLQAINDYKNQYLRQK